MIPRADLEMTDAADCAIMTGDGCEDIQLLHDTHAAVVVDHLRYT